MVVTSNGGGGGGGSHSSSSGETNRQQWDGLLPMVIMFVTIENDIIYYLTLRQKIICSYVKVMQTLHLLSLHFMHILVHFQL